MAFASKLFVFAGALLPGVAGSQADDAFAMIQASASAGQGAAAGALANTIAGRALAFHQAAAKPGEFSFDCNAHPKLCQAPFNCQTFSSEEYVAQLARGLAPEGHGNLRSWCTQPTYEDYIDMCIVKKDLVKAGHIQYEWSLKEANTSGPLHGVDEMDASYCFMEGHCSNAAVTNETTLEEADRMCDGRFGDAWHVFGSAEMMTFAPFDALALAALLPRGSGFHDPRITTFFLKAACAMGNYHCDVMYCKETYCKTQHYIEKYGHLLPKSPSVSPEKKPTV